MQQEKRINPSEHGHPSTGAASSWASRAGSVCRGSRRPPPAGGPREPMRRPCGSCLGRAGPFPLLLCPVRVPHQHRGLLDADLERSRIPGGARERRSKAQRKPCKTVQVQMHIFQTRWKMVRVRGLGELPAGLRKGQETWEESSWKSGVGGCSENALLEDLFVWERERASEQARERRGWAEAAGGGI